MNDPHPIAIARRRPAGTWPTIIVLAFAFVQAGGVADAQLKKALREAAVREAAEVAAQEEFDLDDSVFHQWIFGAGNKIVSTPEHLESLLMLAIEDVDRACSLSEAQRRKLLLAGHGDRKRFLDRVAEARRVFEQNRRDPNGPALIVRYTQPLAAQFAAGLYAEGSFFAKTVGTTLGPDQASRHRESLLDKTRFRYKAKVALILASLDARVGFTADQHRRYAALILEETTPPAKLGGEFEANVVLIKIAKVPEAKVRAIFDDTQWWKLDLILRKARLREESLRAAGLLD